MLIPFNSIHIVNIVQWKENNTEDNIAEIDTTALLEEATSNEVDIECSKENIKALNNKWITTIHAQHACEFE